MYKLNFKLDLKSLIAYPATFWFAAATIPLWSLLQVMLIETIYGQVDNFLGYTRYENYVLFGTWKLVQSFSTIFFMIQLEELTERIRGNDTWSLDMMLLKPIDSQIFATTGRYWFGSISSLLVGGAMIGYGLMQEPHVMNLLNILTYGFSVGLAVALFYFTYLFIQTWLFWVEYLQVGQELWFTITDLGQYPRKLYQGGMGVLLNIVFPITLAGAVPVDFLFGRMPWYTLGIFVVSVGLIGYLTRRFWQYSIKKYSSFSS
jgi:ABC-2 type transport system permease protein